MTADRTAAKTLHLPGGFLFCLRSANHASLDHPAISPIPLPCLRLLNALD